MNFYGKVLGKFNVSSCSYVNLLMLLFSVCKCLCPSGIRVCGRDVTAVSLLRCHAFDICLWFIHKLF